MFRICCCFFFPILKFDITSKLILIWIGVMLITGYKNIKSNYNEIGIKPMMHSALWCIVLFLLILIYPDRMGNFLIFKDFCHL